MNRIIINPSYVSANVINQATRLIEEFARLGERLECANGYVTLDSEPHVELCKIDPTAQPNNEPKSSTQTNNKTAAKRGEYAIYLDKDPYLAAALEKIGVRLFNSAKSIAVCDNKINTQLALTGVVEMPRAVVGRMVYRGNSLDKEVVSTLGYPLVCKTARGSLGVGVSKVFSFSELEGVEGEYILQELIAESEGADIRAYCVGGKLIAAMERGGGFTANIASGGVAAPLSKEETVRVQGIAERAAKELELSFCGVDILRSNRGYLVCEVNSNAFFCELEKTTRINVAEHIARHVLSHT